MADGRRVPIETLQPGDLVASLQVPGLVVDVDYKAQYDWLSTWGLDGVVRRAQPVVVDDLGAVALLSASTASCAARSRWARCGSARTTASSF